MSQEKKDKEIVKEKTSLDDNAFETLEKDFQETLDDLMGDKSLDKFRIEYEKLYHAIKKSHDSEKRLMQKCRELNAEIVSNSSKVNMALDMSEGDQATIASLRSEIEKAWKMVEASHEKETQARETIQSLKLEIANMNKLVEQGAGLTMGQETSVNELLKAKEDLTKERDDLMEEIIEMRDELAHLQIRNSELEKNHADATSKIQKLEQDFQTRNNETQKDERKRDQLARDFRQATSDLEMQIEENKELTKTIDEKSKELSALEISLKETRISMERSTKELDALRETYNKLTVDLEQQIIVNDSLSQENQNKTSELKQKVDEVEKLRVESQRLNKMRESIQRKLQSVEVAKTDLESERECTKNIVSVLERELETSKKQSEQDRKAVEELIRERDLLSKNMLKANANTQKHVDTVKLHEQSKKNLDQEIQNFREEAQKQRKIIYQLEKERDRYINEASDLTQKVLGHMEEVKVREMQIFDYKKKIAESETKLKQQQNLYEAVRSDRNLYSKNLIEAQDQITEMKRKLKIMTHQVDQLKEEISAKESALVKESLEHQRVEKEKETLKLELQRMKQQAAENKAFIDTQEAEERKLLKVIDEADAEFVRQKKELDQVVSERDILGTQLIRRNDELALLYEKIKIEQCTLNKGEIQYNQRLEDIRVLKIEIKKMMREKSILKKSVANVDDLRREIYHLQRELLRERAQCKKLEEEMSTPKNIHRWRKLKGSDPNTYELIQKIQILQKRAIQKTEEVVEKELLIQEKEKLYVELKHLLARQPGNGVLEQLKTYKSTLKEKDTQLKLLSAECTMFQTQIRDHKIDLERLAKEHEDVKKKYFMQKKKDLQIKEQKRAAILASAPLIPHRSDQPRFIGGGYKLQPAMVQ